MLDKPLDSLRFGVGPYWLTLPKDAKISAEVRIPEPEAIQITSTHWTITLGRFQLFIHLDPVQDLSDLKRFIDYTTKSSVVTPQIAINGISGVTHGTYDPPSTWIDWWLKKGDTMICLCLRSCDFSVTLPTQEEMDLHNQIIHSIKYCRDFSIYDGS